MDQTPEEIIQGIVLKAKADYATGVSKNIFAQFSANGDKMREEFKATREATLKLSSELLRAGCNVGRMDRISTIIDAAAERPEAIDAGVELLDDINATAICGLMWVNSGTMDFPSETMGMSSSMLLVFAGLKAMAFAQGVPSDGQKDDGERLGERLGELAGLIAAVMVGVTSEPSDTEEELDVRVEQAKKIIGNGVLGALELIRVRKAGEHN